MNARRQGLVAAHIALGAASLAMRLGPPSSSVAHEVWLLIPLAQLLLLWYWSVLSNRFWARALVTIAITFAFGWASYLAEGRWQGAFWADLNNASIAPIFLTLISPPPFLALRSIGWLGPTDRAITRVTLPAVVVLLATTLFMACVIRILRESTIQPHVYYVLLWGLPTLSLVAAPGPRWIQIGASLLVASVLALIAFLATDRAILGGLIAGALLCVLCGTSVVIARPDASRLMFLELCRKPATWAVLANGLLVALASVYFLEPTPERGLLAAIIFSPGCFLLSAWGIFDRSRTLLLNALFAGVAIMALVGVIMCLPVDNSLQPPLPWVAIGGLLAMFIVSARHWKGDHISEGRWPTLLSVVLLVAMGCSIFGWVGDQFGLFDRSARFPWPIFMQLLASSIPLVALRELGVVRTPIDDPHATRMQFGLAGIFLLTTVLALAMGTFRWNGVQISPFSLVHTLILLIPAYAALWIALSQKRFALKLACALAMLFLALTLTYPSGKPWMSFAVVALLQFGVIFLSLLPVRGEGWRWTGRRASATSPRPGTLPANALQTPAG